MVTSSSHRTPPPHFFCYNCKLLSDMQSTRAGKAVSCYSPTLPKLCTPQEGDPVVD